MGLKMVNDTYFSGSMSASYKNLLKSQAQVKPHDLLLIRKFVRRMKGSKCKIVTGQIFVKARNFGPYLRDHFGKESIFKEEAELKKCCIIASHFVKGHMANT